MIKLVIIADDLTGAIDAGMQLANHRIANTIVPDTSVPPADLLKNSETEVLIFNTESRHMEANAAHNQISSILEAAKKSGIKRCYKKTDSTLRGNIGAELQAFLEASGQDCIAFVPAHPRLKRFTVGGYHYVGKTLIHETEFGKDPLEPITESFIPSQIKHQFSGNVHTCNPNDTEAIDSITGLCIFDCRDESDLWRITQIVAKSGCERYLSGSAGLVDQLPGMYELAPTNMDHGAPGPPVLVINGSLNPISHGQLSFAAASGVEVIDISSSLGTTSMSAESVMDIAGKAGAQLAQNRDIIITTCAGLEYGTRGTNSNMMSSDRAYQSIPVHLGNIAAEVLSIYKFSTIVVIGGDTLQGILRVLQCQSIETFRELIPGVALSVARLKSNSMMLVSKPGGYGEKDAIIEVLNYIRNWKNDWS